VNEKKKCVFLCVVSPTNCERREILGLTWLTAEARFHLSEYMSSIDTRLCASMSTRKTFFSAFVNLFTNRSLTTGHFQLNRERIYTLNASMRELESFIKDQVFFKKKTSRRRYPHT
jgi:hypothetical protein